MGMATLLDCLLKNQSWKQKKKVGFSSEGKNEAETVEPSEEEPAKGIKGKLNRVVSKLQRKKSSEGESSGEVGSKIKGIFRRKLKE